MKRVIATTITLAFPALAPPQEFGHVLGQPAGFQRSGSFGPAAHDCRDEPREGNVVGDVGARLRIERRPSAHARAVFDATGRWLIVLAGYPTHEGQPVRDGVDETYVFREVVGTWPFGDRWEGDATIELYSFADEAGGFVGFGFHSVGGRVQLFARELPEARDSAAVVLQYRSMQKAFKIGRASCRERV